MTEKNDNDKLLNALFPEEWYEKVTEAINFAIKSLNCPTASSISLAKMIIDYNIEKRLDEALNESADLLLPKVLDWSEMSLDDAFCAFMALLETCEVYPRLTIHQVKIKFGKNSLLYNNFLLWKEMCSKKFRKLMLRIVTTSKNKTITLEIQQVK